MIKKIIIGIIIVIVIVCLLFLAPMEPLIAKKMSAKQFVSDWDQTQNGYKTLNPGDAVIIEDTIQRMSCSHDLSGHFPTKSGWVTSLDFSTKTGEMVYLFFDGNLTENFNVGDKVVITLHIIEVEIDGEKKEIEKESWDSELSKEFCLSASCIKKG